MAWKVLTVVEHDILLVETSGVPPIGFVHGAGCTPSLPPAVVSHSNLLYDDRLGVT